MYEGPGLQWHQGTEHETDHRPAGIAQAARREAEGQPAPADEPEPSAPHAEAYLAAVKTELDALATAEPQHPSEIGELPLPASPPPRCENH